MECVKDCWKCEREGCPYTLKVSDEIDTDVKFETLRINAANGSRYKRYRATRNGYRVKTEAKKRYESKNPDKVALWQFKSRYKRKYGYPPSEKVCSEWESGRKQA